MTISTGTKLGRYEIRSKIGAGGMGEVYLAEDTQLGRRVAIKLLPPETISDEHARKRLIREARAAAALDHPNICSIYEVGEADGRSFIAMQYLEGETLDARLKSKPIELKESLTIAAQIADALAEAHSHGIIHRDIKPGNIMITPRGQAKVMDFGVARVIAAAVETEAETQSLLTTPGTIVGTMPYMSPEQVRGEVLDGRSDIFSFAVMLYEMLSGRQPFASQSAAAIISAILNEEPPTLLRYAPDLPEELQRIARKCLEKDRERRYQTMRDVAIDLDNCRREHETAPATDSQRDRMTEGVAVAKMPSDVSKRKSLLSLRALMAGALLAFVAAALVYLLVIRQRATPPPPEIRSLAVLPLKSLDAGENYLGLGIADAVIRRMSQTGKVIVRPTSAVRRYLNDDTDGLTAAKQLGVDSVLEGTVQRAGDRLRVSVNFLRTTDGVSLWADSFDMRVADIFTIQDTISQQLVSRLQLKLDPAQQARLSERYTSSPEAYEYYVKGRAHLEQRTLAIGDRQAIEAATGSFKKAVELDPKYALAFAALGYAYMWMANFNDPDNSVWVALSQQALAQAESLNPQLAEIHSARSEYYFSKYGGWDLAQAAREARQALALNPSVGHEELGTIYDHLGLDEVTGLGEFQRALEIDPTNTHAQFRLAESYALYYKFDKAIDSYQRFFGALGPTRALIYKNRFNEAQPLLEQAVAKNPGNLLARSELALVFALKGQSQEAEGRIPAILEQARNNRAYHHMTYNIACVYALVGKTDEAVKWLRTTAETGLPNYPLFARDEHLDRIRKEPAFIQFMAELKTRWDGYQREFGGSTN